MKRLGKYFICAWLPLLFIACNNKVNHLNEVQLKVMSFNIWHGGGKSLGATASMLTESRADIIGVQESYRDGKNMAVHLADSLGWHSYVFSDSETIISKYPIVDTSENKYGVKIKLDKDQYVWMFNCHLMYCPYEPYQLNGIEYCEEPVLYTAEEAVKSAIKTRGETVLKIVSDIKAVKGDNYPVFLTGDFNEPSCLDWTPRAVEAKLCIISVQWPSTKAFIEEAGLKDSYRLLYMDEVKNPGYTWTSLSESSEYKEVHDRIDFVMFSGNIKPVSSQVLGEKSQFTDVAFDDYPSDHRSIVSTFILNNSKQ